MGRAGRAQHWGAVAIVAIAAAALVWSTGFRGFMPLDQSIVWDGAWRLLQGQRPYADFLLPFGLVPIAIQAAAFHFFGVSWTAYVAHAALANAALAVAVYVVLARMFGRTGPALVYGILSGFALYPPMGTPYPEQHAMLFGVLALVLALHDASRARPSALLWSLVPSLTLLAGLSKPMPGLVPALGALLLLACGRRGLSGAVCGLTAGATACAAVATLGIALSGIAMAEVFQSLVILPGGTGLERLTWGFVGPRLLDGFKPAVALVFLVLFMPWRSPGGDPAALPAWRVAGLAVIATGLVYAVLSDNSPWFGLGGLPLAAALAQRRVEHRFGARAGWAVALAMAAQMTALHLDTSLPRAANELRRADWARGSDAAAIDPRLAGLAWVLPPMVARDLQAEDRPDAYRQLVDTLRSQEGGFVLIGDATILYAMAGKAPPMPALWFHPGLAYPGPGEPARAGFDAALARNLARHDVRTVVVDGERTWTGARATDFAPLAACLATAEPAEAIGRFRLYALPSGCIQR